MDKFRRAKVTVEWPSGLIEKFPGIRANQRVTVVEGSGIQKREEDDDDDDNEREGDRKRKGQRHENEDEDD